MKQFIVRNAFNIIIGGFAVMFIGGLLSFSSRASKSVEICGTVINSEPIMGRSWRDDGCYLTIRTDSATYRVRTERNEPIVGTGSFLCVETFERYVAQVP